MKVALLDLNHNTVGLHCETIPLGAGLVGSHLKNRFGDQVDVRVHKFHDEYEADLKTWVPDVVGIALYSWNTELDLHYAKLTRKLNPKAVIIAGGPNIPLLNDEIAAFFVQYPFLDILINKDAELPFGMVMEKLLAGLNVSACKEQPLPGTITCVGDQVRQGAPAPRLKSLDEDPSPYLNGILTRFLHRGKLVPMIETNRGCPFTCTFCHQSTKYYTKLLWAGLDRLEKEIMLFAEIYKGRHDVRLELCDNNFGTFPRDYEISEIIRKAQDKYDWPRYISTTTGKTMPENILKCMEKLKYGLAATASVQTLTAEVLKNIKRRNLEFDDYLHLQAESKRLGGEARTEIILGLPGETRETFFESLRTIVEAHIDQVVSYTLMNLRGTPLYDMHREQRAAHTFRYRIVPRQFGRYRAELGDAEPSVSLFDIEEVVVTTPTLSFEDYLDCRAMSYVMQVLYNSHSFPEIIRFLRENRVDVFNWLRRIFDRLRSDTASLPSQHVQRFLEETKTELWNSPEELQSFFEKPENYKRLLDGELGRNLMGKYQQIAMAEGFQPWLEVALQCAEEILHESQTGFTKAEIGEVFQDFRTFFLNTRNVMDIFNRKDLESFIEKKRSIDLSFDMLGWVSKRDEGLPLGRFKRPSRYTVSFTEKQKDNIRTIAAKDEHSKSVNLQFVMSAFAKDFWASLESDEGSQRPLSRAAAAD